MAGKERIRHLAEFYAAQDATLKALGRDARLRFFTGRDRSADDENTVRCPPLTFDPPAGEVRQLRGAVDQAAVRRRFGWRGLARVATPDNWPWHDALEQIRAEALACDYLPGVKADLQESYRRAGRPALFGSPRRDAILGYLRWRLAGIGAADAGDMLAAPDQALLDQSLEQLRATLADPARYHALAARLEQALALGPDQAQPVASERVPQDDGPQGEELSSLQSAEAEAGAEPSEALQARAAEEEGAQPGYRIFSRAFDEQPHADELASEVEQQRLRAKLDQAIRAARPALSRLAGRLLHTLYASRRVEWEPEQEDGVLDSARLDRLIAQPLYATPYRQPRRHHYRDTVVSLLLDNSGSLRGHPILVAALCADLLARTLERCGVSVEVLGYTTADWRGGQAREQWVNAGKPPAPGRLNALRHIVYKSADQPWRRARNALSVMLKPELLKENVDGEALQWAHERLLSRPETRRILVVISDGAPSDEATNEANGGDYLPQHLRSVVRSIEQTGDVELMAIGIGYDVTGLYRNAVMIPAEGELGDTLISQLCDLFAGGAANQRRQPRRHGSVWSGAVRRSLML